MDDFDEVMTSVVESRNLEGKFRSLATETAKLLFTSSDNSVTINAVPVIISILGFMLALPFMSSLLSSTYYSTAALFKKRPHKGGYSAPKPLYGHSRTECDYYDDDYDSKYLDRYDKYENNENMHDKYDSRDRNYSRRRGRPSRKDDPYYSGWRRMDNFGSEDLVDGSSRDIKTEKKQ